MTFKVKFTGLSFIFAFMFLLGCGSGDKTKSEEQREYERKLIEARELAAKIRKGDIFDEEALIREKLLRPENVCGLSADYTSIDFGPSPDFKADGEAVLFSDKSTVVYYYYFPTRQRFKIAKNGRNPTFGAYPKEGGDQKFIFEYYMLKKNSWEGEIKGILMNTEANWLNEPKLISSIPAENPYLVDDDKIIIYHIGDNYYKLDDKMKVSSITKEEYESLRDARYTFENEWKIKKTHKGINGVWITDKEEKNWCQLMESQNVMTIKLIPKSYNIYFWGKNQAGICLIKPVEINRYTIELESATGINKGDLFDIYEKEVSPISHEVIGYKKDKYKGTLRVVDIIGNKLICEYQTKLFMEGIFANDAAVYQNDPKIMGKIL